MDDFVCICCQPPLAPEGMTREEQCFMAGAMFVLTARLRPVRLCMHHATMFARCAQGIQCAHAIASEKASLAMRGEKGAPS